MKIYRELAGWLGSISLAVVFAVLISVFVFQPTKVLGQSMEPTLHNKDLIYVSKLPHTFKYEPEYEDIVIIDSRVHQTRTLFKDLTDNPLLRLLMGKEDQETWVKRVIGKPGDVLEFKNHKVYRNGQELEEPYLKETMEYNSDTKVEVPAGHVFVMGDNRNHSRDSRHIGPVPISHVLGKKLF